MSHLFETTEDRAHLVSALAGLEVHCTLRRLAKSKDISETHCTSAMIAVAAEAKRIIEHPLTSATLEQALAVSNRYALRSLDSLQLAAAIQAREMALDHDEVTFITSDQELARAAQSEGFEVWDPLKA